MTNYYSYVPKCPQCHAVCGHIENDDDVVKSGETKHTECKCGHVFRSRWSFDSKLNVHQVAAIAR